jgi:predicted O-linked N-acetylglucosamine transferase (SPINDLY family)
MATIPEALEIAIQHHQAGRLQAAEQIYQQILACEPNHFDAVHLLGVIAHQTGRHEVAVEHIGRAIALNGNAAIFHNNLGEAYRALGKPSEAAACSRRALELNPDYAAAHNNLGNALKDLGRFDEAVVCYRRALELEPHFAQAHNNLGSALKDQGELQNALACYRRAVELNPGYAAAHSNLVYAQVFCGDYDARALYEEHLRWNRQHAMPLAKFLEPHLNHRSPDRRLRVGYVSPDFRDHVVGRNLLPLFREHDHRRFEIFCYADVPRGDEVTRHFRGCADAWRDTAGLTDPGLAERIRDDRVDILVDLTLHMARNRLLVFARKPAPVQVTFAGYPGTTGLAAIDYRLTDPHLDPPGLDDRSYSEESVRLPDTFWCYDPLGSEPTVNALPATERGYITFGCLNNFCKVNAPVLRLWAQVLGAVDRSRLLLLAPAGGPGERTLEFLEQEGVATDRVTLIARRPRAQYLELYRGIDVGLDTFPYNGHTTSLDSLWMGVPVITLTGQTIVGRAGLSQLKNLGLPDLIAETTAQFVNVAVELAGDLPRLAELRATLRDRMRKSPLMDAPGFARNIESVYRQMWRKWCAT